MKNNTADNNTANVTTVPELSRMVDFSSLENRSPDEMITVGELVDTLRTSGSRLLTLMSLDGKSIMPAELHKYKFIRWFESDAFDDEDEVRAFVVECDGNPCVFVDDGSFSMEDREDDKSKAQEVLQMIEQSNTVLSNDVRGGFYSALSEIYLS